MRIAVIGSGIAGAGCAWLLDQRHDVTLYEAESRFGGHSHTVEVAGPSGPIPVDTGFIVYNEVNYPNLVKLFDALGAPTKPSEMSFAASFDGGRLEYAGTNLMGLFAQRRNLLRPQFYRMLGETLRFYREAPRLLTHPDGSAPTLGEYLAHHRYAGCFIDWHLLPMAAAIWSCPVEQMLEFPATSFVRFCVNHGLLKLTGRPRWRTVDGGSQEYVRRLVAPLRHKARLGTPVTSVRRFDGGVEIIDANGGCERFDQVVLACHGDQSARILNDADDAERGVLSAFRYQRNRAVLHRDSRLMPKRRAAWSSWNYLVRSIDRSEAAVTYWMNRLQRLDGPDLFVTLNPIAEPRPELVEREFDYEHPVFDHAAVAAQRRLSSLQGRGGVWFCGAYCGWGFHEDGLASGMAVAAALDCPPPWQTAPAIAADAVRPLQPAFA